MSFDLDLSDEREVTKAELRLFKTIRTESLSVRDRVTIYIVFHKPKDYFDTDLFIYVTARDVPAHTNGYVIFDMETAVEQWKERTPSLIGEMHLQIQFRTPEQEGELQTPNFQFSTDNATSQLVITGFTKEEHRELIDILEDQDSTVRRNAHGTEENIECALRPFVLDFVAMNWTHFVLFPPTLPLNYCSGICTRVNTQTKHSRYLSRRAAYMNNPVGSPEPCCVPNSYATETLKLRPENETDTGYHILDKITVTSCACR